METTGLVETAVVTAVNVLQIIFYLSPLIIAVVTFALAWWRFNLFRIRQPAIKTVLEVYSRRSSPSYIALTAVAVVTNTSRIAVNVNRLEWTVSVLSPYIDAEIESKIEEYQSYFSVENGSVEFPWNVNYRLVQESPRISLEPSDSNTISMSLAIPDWVNAIDVLLEFGSAPVPEGQPLRWAARRSHEINQEA